MFISEKNVPGYQQAKRSCRSRNDVNKIPPLFLQVVDKVTNAEIGFRFDCAKLWIFGATKIFQLGISFQSYVFFFNQYPRLLNKCLGLMPKSSNCNFLM